MRTTLGATAAVGLALLVGSGLLMAELRDRLVDDVEVAARLRTSPGCSRPAATILATETEEADDHEGPDGDGDGEENDDAEAGEADGG